MKIVKCLIFIDSEIISRHFVDSNVFSDLIKHHRVEFVFPKPGHKRIENLNFNDLKDKIKINFIDHHENRLKLWRKLLFVDQMRFKFGEQNKSLRFLRKKTNNWKLSLLYFFYGLPVIWFFFKKLLLSKLKKIKNSEISSLINRFKPDVIIHPSVLEGLFINDLILISKQNKIPCVVIMNSWDNPSIKSSDRQS